MSTSGEDTLAVSERLAAEVMHQGGAMRQTRTTHATAIAVQKPRNLEVIARNLKLEAEFSGEIFFYGWGAGKDAIEGASIKLANAIARTYGNCAIELQPVQDLADSWIFSATFVDLETGFTLTRQFRQSKRWVVFGKYDEFRKEDIRFQIGQSKAVRNVILNAVPTYLIDQAIEHAKSGVRKKIEAFIADMEKKYPGKGLEKAVDKLVLMMDSVGVAVELILDRFKIAKTSALTVDHLIILNSNYKAIESGEVKPEELFPPIDTEEVTRPGEESAVPVADEKPKADEPAADLKSRMAKAKAGKAAKDPGSQKEEEPAKTNADGTMFDNGKDPRENLR